MHQPDSPVIEVFADIWCPFAYLGILAAEEQRVLSGSADVAISVRAWPLELVNGMPLDPATTKAHVDELREQVAPTLFRDFDATAFPSSSLEALALAARAYRVDLSLGEQVSVALREALFEHGRDISDQGVLRQLADEVGVSMPEEVDREAVLADWREGQERGVLGSPHFFCGDDDEFCPSLQITKSPGHGLSIIRDRAHLTAFLERCFATVEEP